MKTFTGNECPICKKEFVQGDEVVVCPDCGAPYHKDCIKTTGECVMTELHEQGLEWKSNEDKLKLFVDKLKADEAQKWNTCPRCGTTNEMGATICKICGSEMSPPLNESDLMQGNGVNPNEVQYRDVRPNQNYNPNQPQNFNIPPQGANPNQRPNMGEGHNDVPPRDYMPYNPFSSPFGGLSPEEEIDGVQVKDLAVFIGKNSDQYLTRFKLMTKGAVPVNLSAFFLNGLFFLYRKMYAVGTLILLCFIVFTAPSIVIWFTSAMQIISPGSEPIFNVEKIAVLSSVFSFLRLGLMLFCGMMANKMYKAHCLHSIKTVKEKNLPDNEYYATLNKKGTVNQTLVIVLGIVYVFVNMLMIGLMLI